MTEFVTRSFGQKEFKVIITTDNKEHYKVAEDFARKLVDHSKPSAVDAVPVVRCKDCCYAVVVRNKGVVMHIGCGYFPNNILSKDFYCANGKAKTDGGGTDV